MISKIGRGIARYINSIKRDGSRQSYSKALPREPSLKKVVIGKDTRASGHTIENLLADSITRKGIDVLQVGTITTPGLSFLTKDLKADMGIMISASHNKATDNGIKFFNRKGYKLSVNEEERIEEIIFDSVRKKGTVLTAEKGTVLTSHNTTCLEPSPGTVRTIKNAQSRYVKFLISTVQGLDLKGMRVALDCAFGAASPFAEKLFKKLGAEVYCINDTPQGDNINLGGATDPTFIKALVLKTHADIGIAVDGDGDRGILVDEKGEVLDGDRIIAIIARYLSKKNRLTKNTVVGTVMSNFGLRVSLGEIGAKMITTSVGDKFVLEALLEHSLSLGGEQSGHIIFLDYLSTPDGLLTALQMLKVMKETKSTLSELSKCMTKFPQLLVNVKVREKKPFAEMPLVREKLDYFNTQLKDEGRILLRYSGTEPLARVMVEGRNKDLIQTIADSLAEQIRQEIGI
jgi:phosphoglucosamine mutase